MKKESSEILLSSKDNQILNTPKLFYQYLKEKYGVGKEAIKPEESIFCSIQVNLPGFLKNSRKHTWSIHLEKTSIEDNIIEEASSLVIGEHWPEEGCSWSRFAEMESGAFEEPGNDEGSYARCWFKITRNMRFEKNDIENFQNISALMKLIFDFQKEVMSA